MYNANSESRSIRTPIFPMNCFAELTANNNKLTNPYVIAEIGLNHNGDFELAKKLIEHSKDSNCHAVKFQLRSDDILKLDHSSMEIGEQYVHKYIADTFLTFDQYSSLFKYTRFLGLDCIISAWDIKSLEFGAQQGIKTLKIASADLTNSMMIKRSLSLYDAFIMSTGMSTESEIGEAVKLFSESDKNLTILHCQSAYPAPIETLNLSYISKLSTKFPQCNIGYSGHELEYHVCLAAYALGARVIEKHITTNKESIGNDHTVSLYLDDLKRLNKSLSDVSKSLGTDAPREISPGEKVNRVSLSKSLTVKHFKSAGSTINEDDLDFCFGGRGLKPHEYTSVVGKKLNIDVFPGDPLESANFLDLSSHDRYKAPYIKNLISGIPVRYHDALKMSNFIDVDFLEFHLSYSDIQFDYHDVVNSLNSRQFIEPHTFHAPDYYQDDHIFDPVSDDSAYRDLSDYHFRQFLDHVVEVSTLLECNKDPNLRTKVITSFSHPTLTTLIDNGSKSAVYERLFSYLDLLYTQYPQLHILPQTLPVNAWYLGGRRYVNIFAHPLEIIEFCDHSKMEICLDTAHTIMASNFYQVDPNDSIMSLLKYAQHFHIVDAKGDSDEGLTFGLGDLDLLRLLSNIANQPSPISYIPEIWQGHHNNGEGFKLAFQSMESVSKK